jgi:hypothetical protein
VQLQSLRRQVSRLQASPPTNPSQAPPPLWTPWPKQTAAVNSDADEVFYGGAAGGGKTDLILGLSLTAHKKALFLRRVAVELVAAVERVKEIVGKVGKWTGSGHGGLMRCGGRSIEFAGCEREDDKTKYMGRPHDLKLFDELPSFTRSQYRFIIGWNRTADPDQRCRVVCTGNPPTTPEGRWVVEEWAPWLDSEHPDPAEPGELRWYAVLDGKLTWLRSGETIQHNGETIQPRSRTFIPARIEDNPVLMQTGYKSVLQGLPEPLRSQMLYGDFNAGMEDDAWQVIPTAWVRAAQARWKATPPEGQPLTALGMDVARGGADATVVAPRRGPWFAPLKSYKGEVTDSGEKAAFLALKEWEEGATVNVDVIGVGASAYDAIRDKIGSDLAVAVNVAVPSHCRDKSGKFALTNVRTAMYWLLREALDPLTGDGLALPIDGELVADLCAPRFSVRASGIVVEPKDDIKERLGRSPDRADALALAHWTRRDRPMVTVFTRTAKPSLDRGWQRI